MAMLLNAVSLWGNVPLASSSEEMSGIPIHLMYRFVPSDRDKTPIIVGHPRSPKKPLTIYQQDHHILLDETLVGFDLELTNDGGAVIYGVTVVSTEADLPESLEGKFTITFSQGDDVYEGTISL